MVKGLMDARDIAPDEVASLIRDLVDDKFALEDDGADFPLNTFVEAAYMRACQAAPLAPRASRAGAALQTGLNAALAVEVPTPVTLFLSKTARPSSVQQCRTPIPQQTCSSGEASAREATEIGNVSPPGSQQ
mmetsp:Transcript_53039/g.130045  ORF Transcript_53039/g.130045 Transcript_53039/m.130045 type:complete len:132 (-) Transcript_53039:549-944(-)